jgi:hypothetical protein
MENPKPEEAKDVKKPDELSDKDLKTVAGGSQVAESSGPKAVEIFLKLENTGE